MTVLTAMREGETRRIGEACRRVVNHLGDQSERLQRARAKPFEQRQRGKIARILLMSEGLHRLLALPAFITAQKVVNRYEGMRIGRSPHIAPSPAKSTRYLSFSVSTFPLSSKPLPEQRPLLMHRSNRISASGDRESLPEWGEAGDIDSVTVRRRCSLGRLVRCPLHPNHLVIGLSGTKRDNVISHAEATSALS